MGCSAIGKNIIKLDTLLISPQSGTLIEAFHRVDKLKKMSTDGKGI
jgi:hypothetical protein